jgi:antitoxin component of RelBE/YafQ-DinJ toxin-antitoxin module
MENTKLTLSVDKATIQLAKEIASEDHISVSKLFKTLINEVAKKKKKEIKMKPLSEYPEWIQELVLAKKPTADFDHKAEYHKHLDEKYGL